MESESSTDYIIRTIREYVEKQPLENDYIITCKPDVGFKRDRVIRILSSWEGWNDKIELSYRSDSPWVSVVDEFARERYGIIRINKK